MILVDGTVYGITVDGTTTMNGDDEIVMIYVLGTVEGMTEIGTTFGFVNVAGIVSVGGIGDGVGIGKT
jgi:hypothetical protein